MIRLGGLVSQKAFGKFEMGKVISNPFATAFIKEAEGEDHEVSMANNSIDTIIKMATELKAKMGEDEKQIPAWIQDHIAKAENLISQASGNYHEYGDSNESVNEASNTGERIQNLNNRIKVLRDKISATKSPEQKKLHSDRLKNALQSLSNIKKDHGIKAPHRESVVNEAGPCWKGYKQVGMKDKGGRQVPNCVPEGVVNEERSVGAIQKDFTKVIAAIASELEKYKSVKGTDKAKQYIANLKKLGAAKEKLEAEMDYVVSNIYVDAELQEGCGCK
jgi:flagellar biosynthesis chaperone FliJ